MGSAMISVSPSRYLRGLGVSAMAVLLAGCAPAAGTVEGDGIKGLYDLFLLVGTVIFVLVAGLIGWSILRYRAPRDAELPRQTAANLKLELVWWALPTILVIALVFITAGVLNQVNARVAEGASLVVRVTGFQWQWRFEYEEAGVAIIGTPGAPPVMVLPVDRTITFLLDSPDVQHSFYVPTFLFKRDAIPGIENRVDLTIQEPATYTGQCAEFCGLLHDQMVFSIRAVSADEFDAWLADQEPEA